MRRITMFSVGLVLLAGLAAGCATRQPLRGQETQGLDRKLSTHAYIEDGDLVTIIVDTRPARDKDGQAYMSLEVSIANHGFRQLTITRESFTLVDREGRRYPMATASELLEGYEMLDFDRGLQELEGIVFNRYAAKTRYPSNFSPTRAGVPGRSSIVRDLVSLPRHGYLIDLIFFPAPATGIRDQAFDLFLDTPELEDPVFVKFEVR